MSWDELGSLPLQGGDALNVAAPPRYWVRYSRAFSEALPEADLDAVKIFFGRVFDVLDQDDQANDSEVVLSSCSGIELSAVVRAEDEIEALSRAREVFLSAIGNVIKEHGEPPVLPPFPDVPEWRAHELLRAKEASAVLLASATT